MWGGLLNTITAILNVCKEQQLDYICVFLITSVLYIVWRSHTLLPWTNLLQIRAVYTILRSDVLIKRSSACWISSPLGVDRVVPVTNNNRIYPIS